jgi:hypothetical protein
MNLLITLLLGSQSPLVGSGFADLHSALDASNHFRKLLWLSAFQSAIPLK